MVPPFSTTIKKWHMYMKEYYSAINKIEFIYFAGK
jgi:hypothetical protein